MYLKCQNCDERIISNFDVTSTCMSCGGELTIDIDRYISDGDIFSEDINREHLRESLPVLEKGTIVIIDNNEHPLHNQIGIVCDIKHKHYRLELEQKKIWVPEHWVKYHECDGIN